jgi:hypothetical protein
VRQLLQLPDQARDLVVGKRPAHGRELQPEQIHGRHLRDEGLRRGHADLQAGAREQHGV